ncbi:PREDICTED: RNA-binding protein 24-like [Ipomoea nil]|uniref:RNA-binding protein 24-like n=1 Tax=Ipomoea nil TaxID=35883 RepID=UPI000901437C|nr:PREDICTED: RNA-binding protein 24-like [Ipomoea nil]
MVSIGTQTEGKTMRRALGDTTYTKVFVGGLAWESGSDSLREYFEQFGEIAEAVVIMDMRSGRSKGYGFVTFRDPSAASMACANPNPTIGGRRTNCNLAALGRPPPFPLNGHLTSTLPYLGVQALRGLYMGSPFYQLLPAPYYGYQSGTPYLPYRNSAFATENAYPQIYDMASTVGTNTLSFGHVGSQPGSPGYTMMRGYFVSSSHMVQYLRPNVNGAIGNYNITPYYSGTITPSLVQSHTAIPVHSPRFTPSNNSEQASD